MRTEQKYMPEFDTCLALFYAIPNFAMRVSRLSVDQIVLGECSHEYDAGMGIAGKIDWIGKTSTDAELGRPSESREGSSSTQLASTMI